jgi:site-specific recombinase XerD
MATFRFEVGNRPTRNKTYALFLCITAGSKRKRLKTSIEIRKKSDFNSKARQDKWIRPSEPNYKAWNEALSKDLEKAKQTYRDLKDEGIATSENIAIELTAGERTSSFVEYAKQRTTEILEAGNIRSWKKYNGFCNKLGTFLTDAKGKTRDLTFAELTASLVAKFETYLYSISNERQPDRKLHPNTIKKELNVFRALVKRAVEVDTLMKPEKNPFLFFKYKGVSTTKEKLSEAEIQQIENCSLPRGGLLWHCRNYFLFSFYCAGIRSGDLIQLRWGNISSDGRLHYQMGKNHKDRDLILVEKAKEILAYYHQEGAKADEYIFPLLDNTAPYAKATTQQEKDTLPTPLKIQLFNRISAKNALINKELKILAEKAGIEKKLSLHISRHSFAKVAKQKGTDNAMLKEMLAHSSVKVTEGYMGSFDTSETDKALVHIFEKDNTPKARLLAIINSMSDEKIKNVLTQLELKQL